VARPRLTASFYGGAGFSLYHAVGSESRIPLSPHFHDEYLICAQLAGAEHVHVAGKLQEFCAGDIALINPQQVHTGNVDAEEVEYVSLYVDREVVRRIAEDLGAPTIAPEFTVVRAGGQEALVQELSGLLELVREVGNPIYPTAETPPEDDVEIPARQLPPDDDALVPAQTLPDLGVESALQRVVIHAFEEFSNLRTPMLRSTNRVPHRKIARALDYMRALDPAAAPSDVTLDKLASVAELSKYHFLRQFNQVVGMTPGAYLRTLRLCHAARLLRTSEAPILDIALQVGFADHPSFSRAFARHMGLTPSEYRKLGPL
jgi:AraC-like DNA-binding protein